MSCLFSISFSNVTSVMSAYSTPPNAFVFFACFFPLRTIINYLKVSRLRKKKSTLSVPWWPAVSSLSETLLRDTALLGCRGIQKSLWLTIHGLGDTKQLFFFFFVFLVVQFRGHQTQMVVYTVFSHFDLGAFLSHYKKNSPCFNIIHWINMDEQARQKSPMHYQLKLYE